MMGLLKKEKGELHRQYSAISMGDGSMYENVEHIMGIHKENSMALAWCQEIEIQGFFFYFNDWIDIIGLRKFVLEAEIDKKILGPKCIFIIILPN